MRLGPLSGGWPGLGQRSRMVWIACGQTNRQTDITENIAVVTPLAGSNNVIWQRMVHCDCYVTVIVPELQ